MNEFALHKEYYMDFLGILDRNSQNLIMIIFKKVFQWIIFMN